MAKEKLHEINIWRGLAFLAVVLQHSIGHYSFVPETGLADGVIMGVLLVLSKFAVPAFIFITGAVFFYNYEGTVRWLPFMRKRIKDIFVPYMVWSVLYALLADNLNLLDPGSYSKLGLWLLTGEASYHLWYIVMIMQMYLLFPLVKNGIVRFMGRPAAAVAAVLVLGVVYVWMMTLKGDILRIAGSVRVPVLSDYFYTYLDRNALMYFFYFMFGAAAGLHMNRWRHLVGRFSVPIAAMSVLAGGALLYRIVSHFQLAPKPVIQFNDTFLLDPLMAVFLTVSILGSYGCARWIELSSWAILRRGLTWIGSHSYTAYLAHALMLNAAVAAADWAGGNTSLRTLYAFLIASGLSVAAAAAIRRLWTAAARRQ